MPTTNAQALALIKKCQEEQSDFLDLGNLGLREIPEEVFELGHLKSLNLGTHYYSEGEWETSDNKGNQNFINHIEGRLAELTKLNGLFLGKNPITSGNWKSVCPHLKVLDLSYTRLESYQPIFELEQLKVLKLSGNRLNDLSFLPSKPFLPLQDLDLSHNNLHDLKALEIFPNLNVLNAGINFLQNTQNFPLLIELTELYLGGNFLEEVDDLNKLTNLGKVSLGFLNIDLDVFYQNRPRHNSNFLQSWPNWLNLEKLSTIDFQGNFLLEIPNLEQYPALEIIFLGQNKLRNLGGLLNVRGIKILTLGNKNTFQDIDQNYYHEIEYEPLKNIFAHLEGLENFPKLEKLYADDIRLEEIPQLNNCTQLNTLDLSQNSIIEIKNLDSLAQLHYLELWGNQISEIKNLDNLTQLQFLSFWGNQISEIKNLDNLTQLQSFSLWGNQISEIKNLDNLTQLQSLSLWGNQISEIKNLDNLTQLQSLSLNSNQISEIKNLDNLTQLQSLSLYNNQISEIKNLTNLTQLKDLSLSNNQISEIKNLDNLTQLKDLSLSNNQLSEIKNLDNLTQLKYLSLSNNQISEIKNLDNLTQLQSLSLYNNQISEIKNLDNLTQIKYLSLSNNQISEIKNLDNLTQLKDLSLYSNQISEIRNLDNLTQLQSLSLFNNQISEIRNLDNLIQLKELFLYSNQISEIRSLDNLTQIKYLSLNNNQISEIKNLGTLTQLKELSLDNNQISEIKNLDNLTQLQSLFLNNNQISEIKNLDNLTQLQSLSLNNNQITEIKNLRLNLFLCNIALNKNELETIKKFVAPQYLLSVDLGNNQFEQLPEDFLQHPYLVDLGFTHNPVVNIAPEICNQKNCLEDARNWFKDLNHESELSHEAKLILIGNGRVGKTCVLKRLFYDTYEAGEKSTHGIALYTQDFDWVEEPYKVKLNSWDFGGQELYHATHRLFMQSRALYLAVWDYKTEYEEAHKVDEISGISFRNHPLHYWLENARSLSPQAPIILVQNKIDRDGSRVLHNPTQLQERFKTAEAYQVSAEKGMRIGALKEAVRETILNMPEVGMKVPAQWMRVKNTILTQKVAKKTITQADFTDLCSAEGLSEKSSKSLLRFLHNTGNLFYHPDLHNDVIILDQEWVLEGIYAIFKRQSPFLSQLYNARGLTDLLALEQPWEKFQPEVRKLFLSMMESCEICFQVTEDKQAPKYLIPECLQNEEPEVIDYVWEKAEANEYRLVYQHDFIHPAFMIRFICRAGRMAKSLDRIWRNGIWITYQKHTQALIRAFPENHQIEVRLRGQHAALLLFLIHKEFCEIFYDPKAVGIYVCVGEEPPESYYHPKAKIEAVKGKRQDYFKEILNPESEELAKKTLKDIVPPPLKTDEKAENNNDEEILQQLQTKLKKAISKDQESGLDLLQEFLVNRSLENDLLIQLTRYNKLERENNKGKMDYNNYSTSLQQILDAVFSMIDDLEEGDLDMDKVRSWLKV